MSVDGDIIEPIYPKAASAILTMEQELGGLRRQYWRRTAPTFPVFPRQINRKSNSTNRDLPDVSENSGSGDCGAVSICAYPSKAD
jgi:hypothetical protein